MKRVHCTFINEHQWRCPSVDKWGYCRHSGGGVVIRGEKEYMVQCPLPRREREKIFFPKNSPDEPKGETPLRRSREVRNEKRESREAF